MKSNEQKNSTNAGQQVCVESQGDTSPQLMPWTAPRLSILSSRSTRGADKDFSATCVIEGVVPTDPSFGHATATGCMNHLVGGDLVITNMASEGNNPGFGPS